MADRLIELAIETLESRKAAIDQEIQQLRAQLKSPSGRRAKRSRGPRSAASRKAQSQRMKEYWAKKRAEAGKAAPKKA
jgi:hypothetical protein